MTSQLHSGVVAAKSGARHKMQFPGGMHRTQLSKKHLKGRTCKLCGGPMVHPFKFTGCLATYLSHTREGRAPNKHENASSVIFVR